MTFDFDERAHAHLEALAGLIDDARAAEAEAKAQAAGDLNRFVRAIDDGVRHVTGTVHCDASGDAGHGLVACPCVSEILCLVAPDGFEAVHIEAEGRRVELTVWTERGRTFAALDCEREEAA